jgi:hypothetical protein
MTLDELIRGADPAREVPPPSGTSATAQWTYAQITRDTIKQPRPFLRLRTVFPVAMALGLILVVGDVLIGTNHPQTSASATLRQAAVTVSDQSTPAPGLGQYLYTETKSLYQVTIYQPGSDPNTLVPVAYAQYVETEESWADSSGHGRGQLTRGPLQFASDADQTAWNATDSGRSFSARFEQTVAEPSLLQLVPDVSGLSTTPGTLNQQIANGLGATNVDLIKAGPSAVFQRAARLLVGPTSAMTSPLASALYQVLAQQPGVTLLGSTTDHSGRQGVGVSISSPSGVSELIIDPTSANALEIQYAPPPTGMPSPSGGPTITCQPVATCASSGLQSAPVGNDELVSPIWSDTVTTGVVDSENATTAPGGPGT